LTQDYAQIEYLVIDGGSTDGTVDLLRRYNDPRMTWVTEKDHGQSDALNKGLLRSTGEIITFINSDDLLMPGVIQFAVNYFNDHPETDALYGDGEFIDAEGKYLSAFKSAPYDLPFAILGGQALVQPGTFWRRRVTDAVGLFDTSLHYRFDFDYWLRMGLSGFQLDYVPGKRAAYRLHSASKTVSQSDRFLGDWEKIVHRIFTRQDLSPELRRLQPEVEEYLEWHKAKARWLKGERVEARPLLRPFLIRKRWGRRALAASMLVDVYFHTSLTNLVASIFTKITGRNPLLE